jgi:excisionase family DNA binding protein
MPDLTIAETARVLGVSERTVRRWVASRRLDAYRIGGRVRVPERALRETYAPYETTGIGAAGAGAARTRAVPVTVGESAADNPLAAWLKSGREAWRAERRKRAMETIRLIAASTKPPRDENDTAEAYVRAFRDGREYDEDGPETT